MPNNPVKRGVVEKPEDWKYSSGRNFLLGDHLIIGVGTDIDLAFGARSLSEKGLPTGP
jgi:hypothetical protein